MQRTNFIVTFWGETYRQRFLDLCLGSFCGESNLSVISRETGHRFIIVCGLSDWRAIDAHPLLVLLRRHVEVVWLELRMPVPDWLEPLWSERGAEVCGYVTDNPSSDDILVPPKLDALSRIASETQSEREFEHYKLTIYGMSQGHLKALDFIAKEGGGASFLAPDMVLSSDSLPLIIGRMSLGDDLVLAAANRFSYAAVDALCERGLLKPGAPSELPARDLVHFCFANPHPETEAFEFDRPEFCQVPTCISFRLPQDGGVVMHSVFWAPLYIAEGVLERVDRDLLRRGGTVDGRFLADSVDLDETRVHVVQDSDDLFLASFTEEEKYGYPTQPRWYKKQPPLSTLYKRVSLHITLRGPGGDALKRRLYPMTLLFHEGDAFPSWRRTLRHAEKQAAKAAGRLSLLGHLFLPLVILTRPDRANLKLSDYGLYRIFRIFRFAGSGFLAKCIWCLVHPKSAVSIIRNKWSAA